MESPAGSSSSSTVSSSARSLQAQVDELGPWFHNLHLPGGVQTAPDHWLQADFPAFKWAEISPHVPEDLHGWTVLDIGCNAGYYSFELARRGAKVTAVDVDPHYLRQARWAAGELGLEDRVEFHQMQVYDLARMQEQFDLVWFMGVLYHLRHPLLALDIIRQRTRRMMVMQTLTMPGDEVAEVPGDFPLEERERLRGAGWPVMAFLEHRVARDPTNWWAPNHACVEAMLRSAGFHVRERIAHETYLCEPDQGEGGMRPMIEAELRAAAGLGR
ncbi:SAM-dependent methyltransferase [Lysobacter defluvii IMMIB APB-9 = DSM 18482]|uniref:SAM-dependent methyltransferase n=1 Tax=Lysobacter defluvii IMMIB APB-9 = DSM 18482 TaxID=1385515 RepID=A0A0A0MA42_9GAMM|nr:SAM-dependent methyltransferase [Lysobacter defluvii IMMIB APB-9 = DSM 18482]